MTARLKHESNVRIALDICSVSFHFRHETAARQNDRHHAAAVVGDVVVVVAGAAVEGDTKVAVGAEAAAAKRLPAVDLGADFDFDFDSGSGSGPVG